MRVSLFLANGSQEINRKCVFKDKMGKSQKDHNGRSLVIVVVGSHPRRF